MSYCRFAWQGSDVYVFEAAEGLTCCGCRLDDDGFTCAEPEQMIAHLARHRRANQFVPAHAIAQLWMEIPGALRPSPTEPRALTVASLMLHLSDIEHELLRQHEQMDTADQKNYPLPAGLEARLKKRRASLDRVEQKRVKRIRTKRGGRP